MSTPSEQVIASLSPRPAAEDDHRILEYRRALAIAGAVLVMSALAITTRAWHIGAPFESSDQVAMPHLIRHSYGIKWLFAHDYGPVDPVMHRGFAEVLSRLGVSIGEAASRFPVMLMGLAQVALTFPLLRRLRRSRTEALAGAACCAVLPTLVTDAHFAWGYLTFSLFFGTAALWATLGYIDDRRPWQLAVAALALTAHCLSNCYAFALPLTLLVIWLQALRLRPKPAPHAVEAVSWKHATIGFLLPCVGALGVILLSWLWTGHGQVGRLIAKGQLDSSGWHPPFMLDWWFIWLQQFGYVAAPLAAAGVVYGVLLLNQGDRLGWLALWSLAVLLPFFFLVNPHLIGYPGAYLIDAVFCAGLLAVSLIASLFKELTRHRWLRGGLIAVSGVALTHMAVGGADDCFTGGRLRSFTGVHTGWGNVKPDTGIKAAGGYVREHVPADAVIMTLHTNHDMEVPVAEYYTGRYVLAGYDLKPDMLPPLLDAMLPEVDVLIAPIEHLHLIESLGGFERVSTIRRGTEPVRFLYARPGLGLPRQDLDVAVANARYDRRYQPCRVPVPLGSSPHLTAARKRYQSTLQVLKCRGTTEGGPESRSNSLVQRQR